MAITKEQLGEIRQILNSSVRPYILFDDDPDGLASFLLVYGHVREGKGFPVKNSPRLGPEMASRVNMYAPDLLVILDLPLVSQEFLDKVNARVVWVDHHPVVERRGVEYFNPRLDDPDDDRPTSYWVYRVLNENLWIGMLGMVGDWFLPEQEIVDEFRKQYPDLLPEDITRPEVALHDSRLGELIRIVSFNLKGMTSDVIRSIKVFTRIKDPYEILEQKSSGGKFIHRKYDKLKGRYDELLKEIHVKPDDKLVLFVYNSPDYSFSKELSNELIYKHPDKIILLAWEYNGEYKCSLRSVKTRLPALINKALKGVDGYGGGHDHAAGACIKVKDFDRFVENVKNLI